MKKIVKLPEAELEIMLIIWEQEKNIKTEQIIEKLEGKKAWKKTTVLNFLARLVDRGFLEVKKQGRFNVYNPIINEQEYLEQESKTFLRKVFGNSIKKLVASLYNSKSISKKDLEELQCFIKEVK